MTWAVVPLLQGGKALRLVATLIAPPMVIERQGDGSGARIFYPTNFSDFHLLESPGVQGAWTSLSTGTNAVIVDTREGTRLFRLGRP